MSSETILPFFAKYIEQELGIIYAEHNYFQLENRLEEIARVLGVKGVPALFEQGQKGIHGQFKQLLLDSATNNETSFFRDPKVFQAIENTVLPALLKKAKPSESLQIWSAASSTGQEALSISMLLQEWQQKNASTVPYAVIGTDISDRALQKAKAATYSELEVQRGLPPTLLQKYFQKDVQGRWVAKSDLTQRISYRSLNLKETFLFPQKFDLVLCRNVLIYQNVPGKIEILKKITSQLNHGGYLIMGSGESLHGLSEDYLQEMSDGAVIYRKKQTQKMAA